MSLSHPAVDAAREDKYLLAYVIWECGRLLGGL